MHVMPQIRTYQFGVPSVVARAGETNRVPLLTGVGYLVTSDSPFALRAPEGLGVSVATNGAASYTVRRPLEFTAEAQDDGSVVMRVSPSVPGGVFAWSRAARRAAARRRAARAPDAAGGTPCPYAADGPRVRFLCSAGEAPCGCGGCGVAGRYTLEGAAFAAPAVLCGCADATGGEPDWEEGEGGGAPSVAAGFSEAAVLFEERYEDAPGVWGGRRSTRTVLTVEASGGACGGTLTVAAENLGRLRLVSGTPPPQGDVAVAAHGSVAFAAVYEAGEASGGAGDIAVRARINPTDGEAKTAEATTTAIRICLTPEIETLQSCVNRHQVGACERIWCEAWPESSGVIWTCDEGNISQNGAFYRHSTPFASLAYNLTAKIGTVSFPVPIRVLLPEDVAVAPDDEHPVLAVTNVLETGEGGCIGMYLPVCCFPTNVSFARTEIRELPTDAHSFSGYFAAPDWAEFRNHTGSSISEKWIAPSHANRIATDLAYIGCCPCPWADGGQIVWRIPDAVRPKEGGGGTNVFATTEQTFVLTSDGTVRVSKFGYEVERSTNGTVNLWRVYAP